jgi:16S rRNA (uracil1498-N3)-methyltransferase
MPAVPRIHVDTALAEGLALPLPASASRHVQVLRLQPGDALTLFDGRGGEWSAEVLEMGRREVTARVLAHQAIERELACAVTLALGMPANERMDTLVEKATELGVAAIQPLVCERSVLRVAGDRAERKASHWQAVAIAACEQSGRNRVPAIAAPITLREWLGSNVNDMQDERLMLSLDADAQPLLRQLDASLTAPTARPPAANGQARITVFSGPEGGLSPAEQALALQHRFVPVSLGPRVLRADTAPLAALALLATLQDR